MKRAFALAVCLVLVFSLSAVAKPKKKTYNNTTDELFTAALRTARERHVVTYVNEKMLMFTFETGRSFTSQGFAANASVEPEGENKATLIINVQNKNGGISWGAGDRMADKFYEQVSDELAGEVKQKSDVRSQVGAISTPPPKEVPAEPALTKPTASAAAVATDDKGSVTVKSDPDGAEVYVDDAFVGNAPATLRLPNGKHTVKVSQTGYKSWSKELAVFAGSEVQLKAALEKEQ
ncbi:MAG TPA: PEGA domain-containing protein [Terriglobales bacterium]|jgi:hypothetical protein|nr:PEGA domain-containing protein [Terriglobales bacterium]